MKKSMLLFVCGMFALVLLSGCTSTYRDTGVDYLVRSNSAGATPYYTEYEIGKNQVAGEGNASVLFWFFQFSEGKYCLVESNPHLSFLSLFMELFSPSQKAVSNAKNAAMYNACEKSKADQIMGAGFEYKITNYLVYAKVECVAKGFPAKIKSVKMLDKQPVILNNWQKIEYIEPYGIARDYSGNGTAPGWCPKAEQK